MLPSSESQSKKFCGFVRCNPSSLDKVEEVVIRTSHHTHFVIGTGARDPQKMDPDSSRETLDHSSM